MPDQCGSVTVPQINTPMPTPTTDPPVPLSLSCPLEEPEQRERVRRLFADAAADPRLVAIELAVWLDQRAVLAADAGTESELPAAEAACLDVMNLIGQVCNGGYEQWVDNGYFRRGDETCTALRTLGLNRFARLTEKALNAIPDETYAWGGLMRMGSRRQAYFDGLDSRFFRALNELNAGSNTPDQRVIAHARRHGIVPLDPAKP